MKGKVISVLCSLVLIPLFDFQSLLNLDLQLSKQEVIGTVIKKGERNQKAYITVSYYNTYKDKIMEGGFPVYIDTAESISVGDHIKIIYQRNFPNIFSEYKKPPYPAWLFVCFILLILAVYILIAGLRK